ncbi:hypothetical protein LINPERPRIM_LOCUS9970, partial [Linum perenne]
IRVSGRFEPVKKKILCFDPSGPGNHRLCIQKQRKRPLNTLEKHYPSWVMQRK